MGAAASASSTLASISSEAIEDYCHKITGQDYTNVFAKNNVDGQVLEKYVGNVDTLIEFLTDVGMTDLDHQQMLYDALMQVYRRHHYLFQLLLPLLLCLHSIVPSNFHIIPAYICILLHIVDGLFTSKRSLGI
jgi:hypothetical protein